MRLFGGLHIALMLAIAAFAVAGAILSKGRRWLRVAAAILLIVNEAVWYVFRYSHEGVHWRNLPLQLCDASVWLAAAAALAPRRALVETAYFVGLAGAGMAILTPDLWSPWPTYPAIYFFLAHGGIVVVLAMAVFGCGVRARAAAVWRSFGWLAAYAAAVGAFNAVTGSNYMYLCAKPAGASLLDAFGAWPWYLLPAAAAGLALFWLLWLPIRAASQ
jgi:hypothetical integral membrane protein (TIGR02206 family)